MPKLGYKHSKDAKKKMSLLKKGKPSPNKGKIFDGEWRKNLSESHMGYIRSDKVRKILSIAKSGNKNPNWKGGQSKEFRDWQKRLWSKRKRDATGTHSYEEWMNLKAQYNWTCPCCSKKEPEIKLTEDHIVPLSRGGSDNIENIQPLCKSCNCRKHTKTIRYKIGCK